jgi:hypothetical protein
MEFLSRFSKISAQERFEKRLRELEEKAEKLERDIRSIALDWENTYDKMRHMMGRIAKRAEMMHQEAEERGDLHPSEMGISPQEQLILSRLPPAQRKYQEDILRRRRLNGREG